MAIDADGRFDGAATWAALTPAQQADIGALALELAAAGHAQGYDLRPPLDRAVAAAVDLLGDHIQMALRDAIDMDELQIEGAPRLPSLLGMVCERCGCSEQDACEVGCSWARPNLCTACVDDEAG